MTKSKRRYGEGSVFYSPERGHWRAAVVVGPGRRKYLSAPTKQAALAKVRALMNELDRGAAVPPDRLSVATFLEQWLKDSAKPKVRTSTYIGYEAIIRLHLLPALGRTSLKKLTPQQVQRLLNDKLEAGLSPRRVQLIHAVLRHALAQALKWRMVGTNVATLVDAPRPVRHQFGFLTPTQARQFLNSIRGDRLEALYTVALSLGLRQGEALGLRWADIDTERPVIHVRKQLQRVNGKFELVDLKTDRSRRSLHLPPTVAESLRKHRLRQLEERLAAGARWKGPDPTGPACHLFTTPIGTPLDAANVLKSFQAQLSRAGLPKLRFHDLRHSCASLLLAQQVSPRVVMEILGHSQISLTMNTYSHVVSELHEDAAARMEALLGRE